MRTIHWIILCLTFQQRKRIDAQDANQGCSETVTATSAVQTLTSLDHVSENCVWTIKASNGMRVRVTIKYVLLSTPVGCHTAQTDIYDRDSPNTQERHIARWCGESHSTFTSWSNYMRVRAKGVHKIPREVEYSTEDDPQCFHKRNVREGKVNTIKSKGYPEKYDRNTECRWEINTLGQYNKNQTITLNFVDVDLKDSENCLYDYIRIYTDSTPRRDAEFDVLCDKEGKTIELYIKSILIIFKTGNGQAGKGFKLLYQASNISSCNKTLTAVRDKRTLTSENFPSFYPSFQRCIYLIQTRNPGKNIKFDVEFSHLRFNCDDEYVLVYDGKTEDSPLLGKWCANHRPSYKSLRGSLLIVFVSNDNSHAKRKGFKAIYKEERCGDEFMVGEQKYSLEFPPASHSISNPLSCNWTLKARYTGYRIFVHFTNTYLLWPSSKIRVDDGSGGFWEFYNSPNQMYMSFGNRMSVELISDGSSPVVHFNMRYWSEDIQGCNGIKQYLTAKEAQQKLLSPGYPIRYPDHVSCVWQIQAEATWDKIKITITVNQLEKANCDDFISFFHGPVSDYSKPDLLVCGGETNIFYSEGNYATVHLYTDKHKGGRGFEMYYATMYGGVIDKSDNQQTRTSSVPIAAIIGAVAGAVLLIIITILLCICVRRQRAARPTAEPEHPSSYSRDQASPFLEAVTPTQIPTPIPTPAPTLNPAPTQAPPRPPPDPTAPPPGYLELDTSSVTADRTQPSAPPLPSLPPPSYEDAVSKGMIQDSGV